MLTELFNLASQLQSLTAETMTISSAIKDMHMVDENYIPVYKLENNLYLNIIGKLSSFSAMLDGLDRDISRDDMASIVELYNNLMINLQDWSKIKFNLLRANTTEFKENAEKMINSIKLAEEKLDVLSNNIDNMKLKLGIRRLTSSFKSEERRISAMLND